MCWQYWLNFSHAVTFFSVWISDSMEIDSMMRTCTLTWIQCSKHQNYEHLYFWKFSGFLQIETLIASYDFCGCIRYDKWQWSNSSLWEGLMQPLLMRPDLICLQNTFSLIWQSSSTLPDIDISRVFPRPFTHGGICPPPHMVGGQVQGDKVLMGGLMRGDIDLMRGT